MKFLNGKLLILGWMTYCMYHIILHKTMDSDYNVSTTLVDENPICL